MPHLKETSIEIFQILIAIILSSIGLKAFLLPNGFLDGGATGIAILLSELLHLELSVLFIISSIPFFIIGWFTVSRQIFYKSIFAIMGLALIMYFENFESLTEDKLIIAVFGGIFLGAGIGLAIKNGAVLDGSEIFGIFINSRFGISIGTTILVFNLILFGITAIVLSVDIALYSILTYIVTGKVIDFTIQGFEDYVGLMIVSRRSIEIQKELIEKIGQGMTIYKGSRGYGNQGQIDDVEIIHTVINRIDTKRAHGIVDDLDQDAFVVEFDVNHVKGGVLRSYLSRNERRQLSPLLFQ